MLVKDIMSSEPVTVRSSTPVREALRLLDAHQVTSVPVVDAQHRVLGVLSEADLLRDAMLRDPWHDESPLDRSVQGGAQRVREVMTPHPLTVHPDTELAEALDVLTTSVIKSMPVVDHENRVVGMLSRSDVLHLLATSDAALEREIGGVLDQAGLRDWSVEVVDGIAELTGPEHAREAHMARTLAGTVRGVVDVRRD